MLRCKEAQSLPVTEIRLVHLRLSSGGCPPDPAPFQSGSGADGTTGKDEGFWLCRRSLCLWPVRGDTPREGLADFLKSRLRISPIFLADIGQIHVKKVASTLDAKIRDEICSLFNSGNP